MRDLIDRSWVRLAVRGEEGQGLVEYGLVIIFVALAVITALTLFGPRVANVYNNIGSSLSI